MKKQCTKRWLQRGSTAGRSSCGLGARDYEGALPGPRGLGAPELDVVEARLLEDPLPVLLAVAVHLDAQVLLPRVAQLVLLVAVQARHHAPAWLQPRVHHVLQRPARVLEQVTSTGSSGNHVSTSPTSYLTSAISSSGSRASSSRSCDCPAFSIISAAASTAVTPSHCSCCAIRRAAHPLPHPASTTVNPASSSAPTFSHISSKAVRCVTSITTSRPSMAHEL
eukprot:3909287-Rhodomonas_salina.2